MAPSQPGHAAIPPLIQSRFAEAHRIVVVTSAHPSAVAVANRQAALHETEIVTVGDVGSVPAAVRRPGDLLVHSLPDVFGRVQPAPEDWEAVIVRDRLAAEFSVVDTSLIEVGQAPSHVPARLAAALRSLFKPICQQPGVRPVFDPPPIFGLAFIAPTGVAVPGAFGRAERVVMPGLPDLVVVRPDGDPTR